MSLQSNLPDATNLVTKSINWFTENARDLPWRRPTCTAWGILVSEVMLQQTPVTRVLPAWENWMRLWPTPAALAAAPTADVLRAWNRLGYPRRALRLQACAQAIVKEHQGELPRTEPELRNLPGIGEYTAAAVAAFAFGQRATVVDINIRRLHARAVSGLAHPQPTYSAVERRLAQDLLPHDATTSVAWNAAAMEIGALICTARTAHCEVCPLASECAWFKAGRPENIAKTATTQAWAGTDRQMRGAIMAHLRNADAPLARAELSSLTMATLNDITRAAQFDTCLVSLVRDGLCAQQVAPDGTEHYQLP